MLPEARAALERGWYRVVSGRVRKGRKHEAKDLHRRLGDDETELHIIPVARGRKRSGGVAKIILGVALVAVSFALPGAGIVLSSTVTISAGSVAAAGVGMALSGVGSLLAPKPPNPGQSQRDDRSTVFGSLQNVVTPGAPVPVVFGECEVGSLMVSAAIHTELRGVAGA